MNKQPEFRGFDTYSDKWVYGFGWMATDYTAEYKERSGKEDEAILYTETFPSICVLKSVGQLTGVPDSNKKLIYSGDLLKIATREELQEVYYDIDKGLFSTKDFSLSELVRGDGGDFIVISTAYERDNPKSFTLQTEGMKFAKKYFKIPSEDSDGFTISTRLTNEEIQRDLDLWNNEFSCRMVTHVKRGTTYVIHEFTILNANNISEYAVIYYPIDEETGKGYLGVLHTRPASEFFDGRFK